MGLENKEMEKRNGGKKEKRKNKITYGIFFTHPHFTQHDQSDSNARGTQYMANSRRRPFASRRTHKPEQNPLSM